MFILKKKQQLLCVRFCALTGGASPLGQEGAGLNYSQSSRIRVEKVQWCNVKGIAWRESVDLYNPPSPRLFFLHLQAPYTLPALSLSTHHHYTHLSLWTSLIQTSSLQAQTQGFYHQVTTSCIKNKCVLETSMLIRKDSVEFKKFQKRKSNEGYEWAMERYIDLVALRAFL